MPPSKVLNPPRRTALARLSGVALAALGGAALSACDQLGQATGQQPSFRGIDITGAPYGRDFRLTDVDGQERTLADYRGKLVLLYFGFVQCPDVCPTALTRAVETKLAVTDDCSAVETLGVAVTVVPGEADNIKITAPRDLLLAELILKERGELA